MKYIIDVDDHSLPLTKLDDAIRQAEDRGYDKGYDEGYDKGKEAMKEVVINNIRKMFERNGITPKFKPEVAIFDACEDCFYADRDAYEDPCNNCKHNHIDFYKPKR